MNQHQSQFNELFWRHGSVRLLEHVRCVRVRPIYVIAIPQEIFLPNNRTQFGQLGLDQRGRDDGHNVRIARVCDVMRTDDENEKRKSQGDWAESGHGKQQ